ncbi:hypothetical protein [Pelagicoccus sp. SDUM812003]|uniref:hypothetical protein n=1 Tax=Pelagicoccus sp. SDUM812003 TaxID=3041267 RepID=UPI00280E3562|nr:hypothetical protein [Pelagicoccus sp. SDUM812003]MDQ8205778.1 hypothetical protein [Pelagicoccus sp. SDUM812003]
MKHILQLLILIILGQASYSAVDPPESIKGTLIRVDIDEVVGSHLTDGTMVLLIDAKTDQYVLISIDYGASDAGVYEYEVREQKGFITLYSQFSGTTFEYEVTFNTTGTGTLALVSPFYTQKGSFSAAWWFHPDDSLTVSLKNTITNIDAEDFEVSIIVEKSTDGQEWTKADGSWEMKNDGTAVFKYPNPEESVFLRIAEP